MSGEATRHAIERTSPKGEHFVGTCVLCHAEGLTFSDMTEECPNPRGVSKDDALLNMIRGPLTTSTPEAEGGG